MIVRVKLGIRSFFKRVRNQRKLNLIIKMGMYGLSSIW